LINRKFAEPVADERALEQIPMHESMPDEGMAPTMGGHEGHSGHPMPTNQMPDPRSPNRTEQ